MSSQVPPESAPPKLTPVALTDDEAPTAQLPTMNAAALAEADAKAAAKAAEARAAHPGTPEAQPAPPTAESSAPQVTSQPTPTMVNMPDVFKPSDLADSNPGATPVPPQPVKVQPAPKPVKAPSSPKPAKLGRVGKVVLIVLLVVALSGLGTLFGVYKYFDGKAKIGTSVAGVSVTGQTEAELLATAQKLGGTSSLALSVNGKQATFDLADLGVTLDAQKTADQALGTADPNHHGWWPVRRVDTPLVYDYSTDDLQKAVDDAFVSGAMAPQDATVALDKDGQFVTTPDEPGATVDVTPVEAAIDTLSTGGTVGTITLTTQTVPASITSAAATSAAEQANAIINASYTFKSTSKSYTLGAAQIAKWVTLTPDASSGAITVGVDQDAVAQDLPAILDQKVAQPVVNKKVLYTPDGAQIAIASWGQDGTTVTDPAAAVTALTQALTSGKGLTFTVATKTQKATTQKVTVGGAYDQPNGSKWVDVNQTTFTVTMYEGTTVVHKMPCVTGKPGTPTHNGTYYIYLKQASTDMKGKNADGSSYVQPHVPWTMYFHNGEALHGAYWRSSFGYRGSHGCVNLPVAQAKIIYQWAPLGTKVVVHN